MSAGALSAAATPAPNRRAYLDWLRGIAVLIMIEAHTLDAWTRLADRTRPGFRWAIVLGGFGAPIFLFLAGLALALAAGSRLRRGLSNGDVAKLAARRGLQVFGLAFLFRLQSKIVSGGSWATLLKVDILNVMGISMLIAAAAWRLGRSPRARALLLIGTTIAIALVTPLVRSTPLLDPLPNPLEWYFRPAAGRSTFTIFPWSAFLTGGVVVGVWLDAARTNTAERRANVLLALLGVTMALGGYFASFLPPAFPVTSFWTTSPTFLFLRLGVLIAAVPIAYAWMGWRGRLPAVHGGERGWVEQFGIASLFVYWIHVELVYGLPSLPLHRALSFEWALAAMAAFAILMFGAVKLKARLLGPPGAPTTGRRPAVGGGGPLPLTGSAGA